MSRTNNDAGRGTPCKSVKGLLMRSGAFLLALHCAGVSAAPVINEIHYNPADNTIRQEFVEIYNPDASAVDLTGWRISGGVDYGFTNSTILPAGGYLVIAEDPAAILATYGASALGPYAGSLSSEGETIRLRDATDSIVDQVEYSVGFPWPVAANGSGASIELINPSLDNDLGSSWRSAFLTEAINETVVLPMSDSGWRWRPGTSEASSPTSAWRQPEFVEDASWSVAQTPIGYGTVDGVSLNTGIANMQNNYLCIFLRNEFELTAEQTTGNWILNYTIDDGLVVWINGVEVHRDRIADGEPTISTTAITYQPVEGSYEKTTLIIPEGVLIEGINTIAVQVINAAYSSSDLGFDLEIAHAPAALPSAGARNNVYASNASPNIRQVEHLPAQPTSTNAVIVTAKVTDPEGVASVSLEYQVVAPGAYIPSHLPHPIVNHSIPAHLQPLEENPAYNDPANWTTVIMVDDGTGDDEFAGDDVYTATLPARDHRTLVRYRIMVEDSLGKADRVPYADDESLNFAYFVYNGVPDYNGHSASTLTNLPVYQVIARAEDWDTCIAWDYADQIDQFSGALQPERFLFNWHGTIVYDGVVYDNIRYRLRGANGRYYGNGKRSMRFRFNDGYYFQARDQDGKKYAKKWRTLTTSKGFENRLSLTYTLNEIVNMYLMDIVGVPVQHTHWFHFRVIDRADEAPDQWRGDFWGLNAAIETADVRFLEEHNLEKGNLYKLVNGESNPKEQQRYQSAFAPVNGEDYYGIESGLTGYRSEDYIRARVDIEKYSYYHALCQAVRHYDYWPDANKNMIYYFSPDYLAENNYNGKLSIIPWDTDASWGPNWNSGYDVVYNALFATSGGGSDGGSTPELWPDYFNAVREVRDLLWQEDQINPVIDEFTQVIADFMPADRDRWMRAPYDAGTYYGLNGPGMTSLETLARNMKNFAFVGGSWAGGNDPEIPQARDNNISGTQGRDAFLDWLQASNGEGGLIPDTPAISYIGMTNYPTDGLAFESSVFTDPQGADTFAAMEWRIAEITDSAAPGYDPLAKYKLEWNACWESGELSNFVSQINIPSAAVKSGNTYRARVRHKDDTGRWSHWSAPVQFTTTLPDISAYTNDLVVSELMYNPKGPTLSEFTAGYDDDDFFEFIELKNVGSVQLNLDNVRLTKGVDFDFLGSAITTLSPGECVLVVADTNAFALRYGAGLPVAGQWAAGDKLSNGGEQVKVSYGGGDPIRDFIYDDSAPWPETADGGGHSLELTDPALRPDHTVATNWQGSFLAGGTPGDDPVPVYTGAPVYVNEALAHTDLPQVDVIELFNPNNVAVDIGGWWLTDDVDMPKKFQIPAGTVINAQSFWAVNEDNDDDQTSAPEGYFGRAFQLSSHGDDVYLYSADSAGNLTGYRHGYAFGGSKNGVSFGRYLDSIGGEHFPAQERLSVEVNRFTPNPSGAPNAGPRIGPVVISELCYAPVEPGALEYIELKNISAESVNLYDDSVGGMPGNTWEIDGIGFHFPVPLPTLDAGAMLLVLPAGSDAAAFRSENNVPADVTIYGGSNGFTGALDNSGEEIALLYPDRPDIIDGVTNVSMIVVDKLRYASAAPWPLVGSSGCSIFRIDLNAYANDPANWMLDLATGSPGWIAGYSLWSQQVFSQAELDTPGLTGMNDDLNGDGFNNLHAYAFGYDPHDAPGPGLLSAIENEGFNVIYRRRKGASDLEFIVQISTNLNDWMDYPTEAFEQPPSIDNGDGSEDVTLILDTTNAVQYLKIKASIP
ncbi:MAG: lamin tail domain-containing protein [Pontiellaceae bacterium]|nr:lamin tail domain-containing protein [Pontiellaceae bacterium]